MKNTSTQPEKSWPKNTSTQTKKSWSKNTSTQTKKSWPALDEDENTSTVINVA